MPHSYNANYRDLCYITVIIINMLSLTIIIIWFITWSQVLWGLHHNTIMTDDISNDILVNADPDGRHVRTELRKMTLLTPFGCKATNWSCPKQRKDARILKMAGEERISPLYESGVPRAESRSRLTDSQLHFLLNRARRNDISPNTRLTRQLRFQDVNLMYVTNIKQYKVGKCTCSCNTLCRESPANAMRGSNLSVADDSSVSATAQMNQPDRFYEHPATGTLLSASTVVLSRVWAVALCLNVSAEYRFALT